MSPTSCLVGALLATTLVACKPSPRYTFHEGTDPDSGGRATLRMDENTGKAEILKSIRPESGYSIAYWKQTYSEDTAMEVIKVYARANADRVSNAEMLKTNSGAPLIIK